MFLRVQEQVAVERALSAADRRVHKSATHKVPLRISVQKVATPFRCSFPNSFETCWSRARKWESAAAARDRLLATRKAAPEGDRRMDSRTVATDDQEPAETRRTTRTERADEFSIHEELPRLPVAGQLRSASIARTGLAGGSGQFLPSPPPNQNPSSASGKSTHPVS